MTPNREIIRKAARTLRNMIRDHRSPIVSVKRKTFNDIKYIEATTMDGYLHAVAITTAGYYKIG